MNALWLAPFALFLLVAGVWLLRTLAYRRKIRSLGANLSRYAAENQALAPAPGERIILVGDEIAERWDIHRDFPELDCLNRGITGETTLHLLARFRQDVVGLEPRIVILLAGRNDSAWKLPRAATQDHIQLMARLAAKDKIELILTSVLPVRRGAGPRRLSPSAIAGLNNWLRNFAREQGFAYADLHAALGDKQGWLRPIYTDDGLLPNDAGYRAMAAALCPVLERLLERAATRSGRAARL